MSERTATRPDLAGWETAPTGRRSLSSDDVQRWLDGYVRAWQSYDSKAIGDLWTTDAVWYDSFGIRARGRDAIVGEWLGEQHLDTPGGYDAYHVPIAIDGDLAVTHGRTRFFDPATGTTQTEYDNVWVLRFGEDGRCAEFHEWYARRPDDAGATVRWKLHLESPPETVYALLATDDGRARFWAETAGEAVNAIDFVFPDGLTWHGEVLEATPATRFAVRYFGGTTTTFELRPDGAGGTDLELTDAGIPPGDEAVTRAGWVSVLMSLKAAADFGVDLRNHDPSRTWDDGYCDN